MSPLAPSEYGTQAPTDAERKAEIATHKNNPVEHADYVAAPFPRTLYKDAAEVGQPLQTCEVADASALDVKVSEGWREHPKADDNAPTAAQE